MSLIDREMMRPDFVKYVSENGPSWASQSHEQFSPCHIDNFAIMRWELSANDELFTISWRGEKLLSSIYIQAFYLFRDDNFIDGGGV